MKIENMSEGDLFDAASESFIAKNWAETIEYLDELLRRAPTHIKGRHYLAMVQNITGRYRESIDNYDLLLFEDPDNADYIAGKGSVLISAGFKEDGIKMIEKALEIENIKEYRGALIKLRGEPINLLEIKGIGEKYREKIDGMVMIKASDLAQEIAEKCYQHNAMVRAEDFMREALATDLKSIEKVLEIVASNTGIYGNLAVVDEKLLIVFEKKEK